MTSRFYGSLTQEVIKQYHLQLADDIGFTTNVENVVIPEGDPLEYLETGLGDLQLRYGRYRIEDFGGNLSAWSNIANATTEVTWSPATLTHAVHWWKAKAITGLSNTDPTGTWEDLIGSSDFSGSGSTRPLYYTNSGDPYLEFDGTDDMMSATITSLNDYIVIAVYERVSTNSWGRLLQSSGTGIILAQLSNTDAFVHIPAAGANITLSTPSAPTSDMAILAERIGSAGRLRVNGSEDTNTLSTTASGTTLNLCSNGSGEFGNKRIKEIIICDAAFATGEEALLATYLNDEYGLTL